MLHILYCMCTSARYQEFIAAYKLLVLPDCYAVWEVTVESALCVYTVTVCAPLVCAEHEVSLLPQ